MDDDEPREGEGMGENLLTILLAGAAAAGCLVFLIVISGGYFIFLAAVVAGMALFALLHYLLWGHALSEEISGDRDLPEIVQREETEAFQDFVDDPHFPRGY